MTGTNDKVRSIFLTVLMVLSVFAGTVAFAGSAAAAGNVTADTSSEVSGQTGVTYTISGDVSSSFTLQYIDIDASSSAGGPEATSPSPDFSATTESDITVIIDGVEYTDGYTGLQRGGNGQFQFKLQNSQNVQDNITVMLGDVENPVANSSLSGSDDEVTYHFVAEMEDSGNNVEDTFGPAPYTIDNPASTSNNNNDQDPPYERGDGDANFTTQGSQLRWAGQQLFFESSNQSTGTEYQLVKVGDQISNSGEYQEESTVTAFSTDSQNRALISTSGLNGRYAVKRSSNGDYVVTNKRGVVQGEEPEITSNNFLSISNQQFSASFDDNTVTEDGSVAVDFSSNRASYTVEVTSDDLGTSKIRDIFGDDDTSEDGVQLDVTNNEFTAEGTADVNPGNYTFDFEVVDTGKTDSDYLDVSKKGQKAASFDQAVYSEERGDNASFTVNLDGGASTALVRVGSDDVNYNVTLRVTDGGDEDGKVTVSWNTWQAGRFTNENVAFEATSEDDSVSNVQRFSNRIPQDSRVSATDYDLAVYVDGDEEDVGVITLNKRSTNGATQYVAPGGTSYDNATDVANESTEASTTALGDDAVTMFDVSGIYGYTWDNATLQQNGVNVTIEEAGDTINVEPKQVSIDQDNVEFYFDDDANQFYLVVDTDSVTAERGTQAGLSLKDGETYNVTFEIDGDYNPYVDADETEEVTAQFTLEDPMAEFDTAADGNVTVESAADQQITGTTNLAPGSEITIRARSTGDSPFLKSNTTEVAEDGTFAGTFDFSNVSQDTQFTVTAPNEGFEDDAETPGIVAPAPTASVTINDQTSDGSTVTVASASLSDGGFVTIHDGSLLDGDTFESVRGTSAYLESGEHSDITVSLDEPYEEDGTIIAMPHLDTNDNEAYDFVSSDGAEDGPYTDSEGNITLDSASLTISTPTPEPSPTPTDEPTPTPTDEPTPTPTDEPTPTPTPTSGGGPGFGLAAALIALAGAALLALRRD